MGEWIRREKDKHKHDYPLTTSRANVEVFKGDTWRCECGQVFTVTGFNYGSQRDPINPPLIKWERFVTSSSMYDR